MCIICAVRMALVKHFFALLGNLCTILWNLSSVKGQANGETGIGHANIILILLIRGIFCEF